MLHCDFCGCCSTNRGKGWVAHLSEGEDAIDEPLVALYCPPCANTVFGYRPDVAAEYVCFWEPLPADPRRRLEELWGRADSADTDPSSGSFPGA